MTRKYHLDTSSKKYNCPSCREKTFVRLYDSNNNLMPEQYGRCDREQRCGYFSFPPIDKESIKSTIRFDGERITFEFSFDEDLITAIKHLHGRMYDAKAKQWYINSSIISDEVRSFASKYQFEIIEIKPVEAKQDYYFIPEKKAIENIQAKKANNLIKYLLTIFDTTKVDDLIERYRIGTSEKWEGATLFFYVDGDGKYRRGKIMLYDPTTGKRQKNNEGKALISSVHSRLGKSDNKPPECLFGLHLVKDSTRAVAIVESEKTACIASIYVPQYTWLACGSLSGLTIEKIEPLKGKRIMLFPDVGGFNKWEEKTKEFIKQGYDIVLSDYTEKAATEIERLQGWDLADYFLKLSPIYDYPSIWDAPAERNSVNDYWRLVNWATMLNDFQLKGKKREYLQVLDEMERKGFAGIPDDILQEYAPALKN